eukprot:596304-Pleurochrysis_carterae.AAC.1
MDCEPQKVCAFFVLKKSGLRNSNRGNVYSRAATLKLDATMRSVLGVTLILIIMVVFAKCG